MLRTALAWLALCGCTSLPQVPPTSAVSEDASAAPLPHVGVALSEDAPPLDDAATTVMPEHHHHGGGQ